MKALLKSLFLLSLLCWPVQADELFVKNQPFHGFTLGSGLDTLVELSHFAEVIGVEVELQQEQALIRDTLIRVQTGPGGRKLVSLLDIAGAAGLKVRHNEELGTLDVHGEAGRHAIYSNWTFDKSLEATKKKRKSTRISTPTYSIVIPSILDAMEHEGDVGPQGAARLELTITPKNDPGNGLMTLQTLILPERFNEKAILSAQKSVILEEGGRKLKGPTPYRAGGLDYHRFRFEGELDGKVSTIEQYLHFNHRRRQIFMFLLVVKKEEFKRRAPALRLALKNFRVKHGAKP